MPNIIVVANQKGGVGKTTTAVNVAAAIALAEKRVLLIDLDPQANATSGLGVTLSQGQPTVYNALLGSTTLASTVVHTGQIEYLDLIPAESDLSAAEIELIDTQNRNLILSRLLTEIHEQYDIVILDCPPSLGLLTLNALSAATGALLPLQCEYYALEGVSQLLNTIKVVQERLNPALQIVGVLLTMYDGRLSLCRQVAEEAREFFKNLVFQSVVPRNVRVAEAPGFGKPVVLYDTTSSGAAAYLATAQELLERLRLTRHPGPISTVNTA